MPVKQSTSPSNTPFPSSLFTSSLKFIILASSIISLRYFLNQHQKSSALTTPNFSCSAICDGVSAKISFSVLNFNPLHSSAANDLPTPVIPIDPIKSDNDTDLDFSRTFITLVARFSPNRPLPTSILDQSSSFIT